jgi:DNA adenine methylase
VSAEPITRPALRWFGGKWRLGPWIVGHLPPHDAYCELYGGAASVLLRKPPAKLETWNDLHGRLVNFFTVLRSRPDELVRALELTPYARAEYEQAREVAADPLEDARRFYVLAQQGRVGAATRSCRSGWRYECEPTRGSVVADEFAVTVHLRAIAERLKHVQVEQDEALAVLRRYDRATTLHYVDPPYVIAARRSWDRYAHELDSDGHRALAETLHAARGMVVLSGYPSALYDDLYGAWAQVDRAEQIDSGRHVTERLWFNPAAAAALDRARHRQLTFGESA